jgi:predicted CXXCH cytochrome family protein
LDSLRIVVPNETRILTNTASHSIIGFFDPTRTQTITLSAFLQMSSEFKVKPASIRNDFAQATRELIGEGFEVTRFRCKSCYPGKSSEDREYEAEYPADSHTGIRLFWESKQFRAIYSKITSDTTASYIRISVEGNKIHSINVNNQQYQEQFGSLFHFDLSVKPRGNLISVRSTDLNGYPLGEISLEYYLFEAMDPKEKTPPGFVKTRFHTPNLEALCKDCHQIDFTGSDTLGASSVISSCYACHQTITRSRTLHGPVSTWNCFSCHESTKNDSLKFNIECEGSIENLCFRCHTTTKNDFSSRNYQHGPVTLGECTLCHDPHGSGFRGQIRTPVVSLCGSCHGERYLKDHPVSRHPSAAAVDPLLPSREFSCISCHDPHGGNNPNFFYSAVSLYQLCQECHKK